MKRAAAPLPDPDDMFADTRMTFGEHIEDLRTHLLRAIYGFMVAFIIAIPLGKPVLRFIADPVEDQLRLYYERYDDVRAKQIQAEMEGGKFRSIKPVPMSLEIDMDVWLRHAAKRLNLPAPKEEREVLGKMMRGMEAFLETLDVAYLIERGQFEDSNFVEVPGRIADPMRYANEIFKLNRIINPPRLSTLSVQEAFVVLFKVIMMTGLVLASPWVFYQIWSFIAAGLYPHEKRLVNVYGPFSVALFLVGVVVCELFVIPKAIEAMLWFNELLGFQPDLRLNEWLGFAIFMPVVFGVSFQTPLVMLFLERIGVFTVDSYRGTRRISWFLMAIFAGIITPSTDAFSMLFLWVPMSLLYELGIFLCLLSPRQEEPEWQTSETEELVEV